MRQPLFVFTFLLFFALSSKAAINTNGTVAWKTINEGVWVDYDGDQATHIIYLPLDFSELRGLKIKINCPGSFYVFIDGALASKVKSSITLSMDSLSKKYSRAVVLGIYSKASISQLESNWLLKQDEDLNPRRERSGFPSFVILVTILLLIFITALLRTNPQLTQDYLNITKLFTLRDRDEGQILRITSSVNLLFYFFCSALAALALLITAHSTPRGLSFLSGLKFANGYVFWQWLVLSALIFAIMMLKLLVSNIVSGLFGWKDLYALQFFNFIRMVILSLFIIVIISLFGFSVGISLNYFTLLKLACLLLVVGAVLIYVKLLARATFHFFHLFFYLCATEVLPLGVLIKMLLY